MISGKAKLAGVIGWPVSHSLSPRLHNYWLETYQIDGAYIPLAVKPEDLKEILRTLPKMGFSGCNLTIPHKEAALEIVDEVTDIAQRIGAVNTIIIRDKGSLLGTNTDASGFMDNIRYQCTLSSIHRQKAVVLGAGGAGRAICAALQDEGFQEIIFLNRTRDKAEKLAADMGYPITVADWNERDDWLKDAGLLVNTTSLGLAGKEPLELSLKQLPPEAIVADIVYVPLLTPLLAQAQKRGNQIVTGLGMLIHQAAPGFHAWFGTMPMIDRALEDHMLKAITK